jgi:hypothetical protein
MTTAPEGKVTKVDPFAALLEVVKKLPTTPVASTTTKPATTVYPSVYSTTQAKAKINDIFQSLLKRDATNDEVKFWSPKLIAAQKASPSQQTVKIVNGKNVVSSIGGLDETQWLTDALSADPTLKVEITKFRQTDPTLLKRQTEKKIYDDAIKAAAGDPDKIAQVEATTSYGQGIKSIKDAITQSAFEAGATLGADVIDSIAKEAYDKNLDNSRDTFNSFVKSKFKFDVAKATGAAGDTLAALTKTAAANGLDLQKAFGSNLPNWIAAIDKGESVDTYKRIIRETAKIGMPDNVKKLIDNGVDLEAIYSPYKNVMASTLEINPETISLSDPTLRSAITAGSEVPLYDFERQLRKDTRWQYTNQAKGEVANATQQILKDFGFMG